MPVPFSGKTLKKIIEIRVSGEWFRYQFAYAPKSGSDTVYEQLLAFHQATETIGTKFLEQTNEGYKAIFLPELPLIHRNKIGKRAQIALLQFALQIGLE